MALQSKDQSNLHAIPTQLFDEKVWQKQQTTISNLLISIEQYCTSWMAISDIIEWSSPSADCRLFWQGAAPCGPFLHLICALRLFLTLYMRPVALSVRIAGSVCVSVSKLPKRLLNVGTKSAKNREKNHRRLRDHFRRIQFIIRRDNWWQ